MLNVCMDSWLAGVCNFSLRQMKELVTYCGEQDIPRPALVQNECHPYLIAKASCGNNNS